MSRGYVEVTRDEMDKFLNRGWRMLRPKPIVEPNKELAYILKLGDDVGIKIFTSIPAGSVIGRGVGDDAIRVLLVSLRTGRGMMGKARSKEIGNARVNRTQNWRTNLKKRIELLIELYHENLDYWENRAVTSPSENIDAPSDKQVEYALQLISRTPEEFNWSKLDIPGVVSKPDSATLEQLGKRSVSNLIDTLMKMSQGPSTSSTPSLQNAMPTEKQMRYLGWLLSKVDRSTWYSNYSDRFGDKPDPRLMSRRDASILIDVLVKAGFGGSRYGSEIPDVSEFVEYEYDRV